MFENLPTGERKLLEEILNSSDRMQIAHESGIRTNELFNNAHISGLFEKVFLTNGMTDDFWKLTSKALNYFEMESDEMVKNNEITTINIHGNANGSMFKTNTQNSTQNMQVNHSAFDFEKAIDIFNQAKGCLDFFKNDLTDEKDKYALTDLIEQGITLSKEKSDSNAIKKVLKSVEGLLLKIGVNVAAKGLLASISEMGCYL